MIAHDPDRASRRRGVDRLRGAGPLYGLACDNLIAAEVVLADGSVVTAGEQGHADLFWGIRGGGGNFGIVTEFEFRLHALGPTVLAGLALFPIGRAADVLRGWRDWVDAAPDEISSGCVVLTAPPEPFVPAELQGERVLGVPVLHVGDAERGADLIRPLKDLEPAVDLIAPMPYTAFQAMPTPRPRPASAATGAASTCASSATPRSTHSSPTPSTWPHSARPAARW